ncbi:MAG: VanZ family protein [Steroidobacteraceae bacterium]
MARQHSSGLILWLLLGVIALIGYGSLYPFDFNFDSNHPTLRAALAQLSWARAGRADRVRNVLLYLPLGFCLMLWLRDRLGAVWAAALATLLGTLLSLSIELAQVYLSIRVPSLMDIALNTMGTLLGAIGGTVWRNLNALVYLPPHTRNRSGDRSALLLICTWVLWRLAEFNSNVSLTRLKLALQPLLEWNSSLLLMLKYLLLWLVVAQAVLSFANRQRSNEVLLTVISVILIGRLLFVTPAFTVSELLALLLLLPTMVVLHKLRREPQGVILLLLFAALFVYERLAPFNFSSSMHSFDFWPFMHWFAQGVPIDADAVLRKLFMFSALMWLAKDAGLPMRSAVVIVVSTVLGIEVLQLWQVGRHSSLTDPALALAMGVLMLLASDVHKSKHSRKAIHFRRY